MAATAKNLAQPIELLTFHIDEDTAAVRLDQFLARRMPWRSRSFFRKMITRREVTVNKRTVRPSRQLNPGDVVRVDVSRYQKVYHPPEHIELDVIHEDHDVLVLNKQPGIVVHPTGIHLYDTLMNAVHHRYESAKYLPRIVHRLDRETSGVLVLAKNDSARTHLARQIEGRMVAKSYRALVHGIFPSRRGDITLPIGSSRHSHIRLKQDINHHNGLPSHSVYTIAASAPFVPGFLDGLSLVDIDLKTGRQHQIRVHLAASGHPILADKLYGRERSCSLHGVEITHHLLHALRFGCIHPGTQQPVTFTAPLPHAFAACVAAVFGPAFAQT